MAQITPFTGILYNSTISDPSLVVAPPYDVISNEAREALYTKSPYNIVRIDYGRDESGDGGGSNKYARAAALLRQWLAEGVLERDTAPAYYGYEVRYTIDGAEHSFRGFFARVRIEPFERGIVLPHEETRSKPKSDRLNLMRATHANTSPIFSLYHSPSCRASNVVNRTAGNTPRLTAVDHDGNEHRIWSITDPEDLRVMSEDLADLPVFIADGHHRYETALAYQREAGDMQGADSVLMFLANMADSGLSILPTHRLVRGIDGDPVDRLTGEIPLEPIDISAGGTAMLEAIRGTEDHCFCMYAGGRAYILRKNRGAALDEIPAPLGDLDVTVLHRLILDDVLLAGECDYEKDVARAVALVDNGDYQAAFFLNPTRLEELRTVALDGKRMPPKSTYFYPKLLTGMVMNSLE